MSSYDAFAGRPRGKPLRLNILRVMMIFCSTDAERYEMITTKMNEWGLGSSTQRDYLKTLMPGYKPYNHNIPMPRNWV